MINNRKKNIIIIKLFLLLYFSFKFVTNFNQRMLELNSMFLYLVYLY